MPLHTAILSAGLVLAVIGMLVKAREVDDGITELDRRFIERYFRRSGRQVAGLRRAGVDAPFVYGIRLFDVKVVDGQGCRTIERIGMTYDLPHPRPKYWRYGPEGRRPA